MFAVFVILFAANFLAAENFVIPNVVDESISIQTSTTESIVENAMGDTISMQSTVETSITDIDSPLENIVEEIAEETELEIVEDIAIMGSGIGNISGIGNMSGIGNVSGIGNISGIGSASGIGNISGNVETLAENIEEMVSSPMQNLESSLITENIISEMGSSSITPMTMGSEIIEEAISENIESSISPIPLMQNMPLSDTLSTMEELEIMSDVESIVPYPSGMGPLSSITSQIGRNYVSPMMGSISGVPNSLPNMPYPSGMRPSSSITSQSGGNYISPMMESIPGMGNSLPNMPYPSGMRPSSTIMSQNGGTIPGMGNSLPNMPYPSGMRPSSTIMSQNGGNYISPMIESIPGIGNLPPNMPYPSMTGLTAPISSTVQQLESQVGLPSSTMPYLNNMSPLMPGSPGMSSTSSIQELESEFDYDTPGPMMSNMGYSSSYRPNMGLLSPITSTIKQVEDEIEESSIPLMNLINQSPLMPEFPGPVVALPSLGTTLEELEEVTTSNIPLLGTMTGGGSMPMRPMSPNMPLGPESLINVPSIGSALMDLEQGINSATLPLMETMPIIGNSLPLLQKPPAMRPPAMGGYNTNLSNKENILPLGPLSPGNMGYPGSGSRLPFINSVISPFQNLPLLNRYISPLTSNLSNMQQPNGGLFSPLRQAMSNLKMAPSLLQQPSMPNMLNMGPNSMSSNIGMSELTALIDQDSFLPSSQKTQLLSQMSSLGPSTLSMMQNMYRMIGSDWQSRLHMKIEQVRQARRELMMAIEAVMSGHPEEVPRYIMAAIAALGNSPMTTALLYALNQDRNSLPLIANMSRLILDRLQ